MGELKQRLVAAHKLSQFLNGQSVGLSIRFIHSVLELLEKIILSEAEGEN